MTDRGLVARVHGGASALDGELEPVLSSRSAEHGDRKQRIGRAAAARIPDGCTVLITGGTTTEAMVPHLAARQGLTVLTNGLNIASQLTRCTGITVVVLGGVLRHDEMSLLGPIAENTLADFHVDRVVCGTFGIHPEFGLSAANVSEAGTDRRMVAAAESVTVLADSSKLGRRGPVRVAGIEQVSCVITDDAAPAASLAALREAGVEVLTC
jgi:DeoR/GlpR family transcriptional regulator of sugar metabolism